MRELKMKVGELVDNINRTCEYSASKITALHNEVFQINEPIRKVASHLIRNKMELQKWLDNDDFKTSYK